MRLIHKAIASISNNWFKACIGRNSRQLRGPDFTIWTKEWSKQISPKVTEQLLKSTEKRSIIRLREKTKKIKSKGTEKRIE